MRYTASVTIRCAGGLHTRPSSWLSTALQNFEAAVEFRRGDKSVSINRGSMLNLMEAAASLSLHDGETFELVCSGPQGKEAFDALQERFVTGFFEGSEFTPRSSTTGNDDG